MAGESTITEHDLDASAQNLINALRGDQTAEPDLVVDGLSDSVFSRLIGLFGSRD